VYVYLLGMSKGWFFFSADKDDVEGASKDDTTEAARSKSAYALWSAEERTALLDEQPKLKVSLRLHCIIL
jgi:hypothetical protein